MKIQYTAHWCYKLTAWWFKSKISTFQCDFNSWGDWHFTVFTRSIILIHDKALIWAWFSRLSKGFDWNTGPSNSIYPVSYFGFSKTELNIKWSIVKYSKVKAQTNAVVIGDAISENEVENRGQEQIVSIVHYLNRGLFKTWTYSISIWYEIQSFQFLVIGLHFGKWNTVLVRISVTWATVEQRWIIWLNPTSSFTTNCETNSSLSVARYFVITYRTIMDCFCLK